MRGFIRAALVTLALAASAGLLGAQSSQVVRFAGGNDNASVEASVTGDSYEDYVLGAKKGQTMNVSLSAKGNAYFNIMPPGSDGEAIYNGSIYGNDATGVKLPIDGDYTIRVYLMGDDADSGKKVPFTLSMSIM